VSDHGALGPIPPKPNKDELERLAQVAAYYDSPFLNDIMQLIDDQENEAIFASYIQRWPSLVALPSSGAVGTKLNHPAGWNKIIEELFGSIASKLADLGHPSSSLPIIIETREMFGRLSVFHSLPAHEILIQNWIKAACIQSTRTCWECGVEGRMVDLDGVIAPRCEKCFETERKSIEIS